MGGREGKPRSGGVRSSEASNQSKTNNNHKNANNQTETPNQTTSGNTMSDNPRKRKPYKFTKAKRDEYLKLLEDGMRRGTAAKAIGVHRQTVSAWAKDFPEFQEQIDSAELIANEQVEEAMFEAASSGNVTAGIFWLCNRMPDDWESVNKLKQEISGMNGGPIQIQAVPLEQQVLEYREKIRAITEQPSIPAPTVTPVNGSGGAVGSNGAAKPVDSRRTNGKADPGDNGRD